jgi:hypothetical protein
MSNSETVPLTELEARIHYEHDAACAAIRSALRHAADAGAAINLVNAQMTQNPWQHWVDGGGCPVSRHAAMVMLRLSKSDLEAKSQMLTQLMLDRAAEYVALSPPRPKPRTEREMKYAGA